MGVDSQINDILNTLQQLLWNYENPRMGSHFKQAVSSQASLPSCSNCFKINDNSDLVLYEVIFL